MLFKLSKLESSLNKTKYTTTAISKPKGDPSVNNCNLTDYENNLNTCWGNQIFDKCKNKDKAYHYIQNNFTIKGKYTNNGNDAMEAYNKIVESKDNDGNCIIPEVTTISLPEVTTTSLPEVTTISLPEVTTTSLPEVTTTMKSSDEESNNNKKLTIIISLILLAVLLFVLHKNKIINLS